MTTNPTDTPLGTPTPRTVAAKQAMRDRIAAALAKNADFDFQVVSEEFALTLEKELNEATALLRQKDEALQSVLTVIEERAVGHVILYSDRLLPLIPVLKLALTPKSPTP